MDDDDDFVTTLSNATKVRAKYEDRREQERNAAVRVGEFLPGDLSTANKTYLANTIRSVDGHNRRVEEGKCWAQRRADKRARASDDSSDGSGGDDARGDDPRRSQIDDERAMWAVSAGAFLRDEFASYSLSLP